MASDDGAFLILAQAQLGNALADVYNATAKPMPFVAKASEMWICNTDVAPRALTLRIGAAAAPFNTTNSLFDACVMPANATWRMSGGGGLIGAINAGYKLQGLCDVAAKITITIFGFEQP
jgi:hypothetical protein